MPASGPAKEQKVVIWELSSATSALDGRLAGGPVAPEPLSHENPLHKRPAHVKPAISLSLLGSGILAMFALFPGTGLSAEAVRDDAVRRLAEEVRSKGWIVFCARSEKGDWDLFLCRPDGSSLRNITTRRTTASVSAALPRRKTTSLSSAQARREDRQQPLRCPGQLVIARADGTDAAALGGDGEYSWASWSPDGKQIACLSIKGIFFVDVASKKQVRALPPQRVLPAAFLSPDGQWLCGVSNAFGASWSVGRISAATGEANAVSTVDCCTPDWFPDSRNIIFSNRPLGQKTNNGYGWTQL